MRILVYPHDLAMGGSQINAIDLAAEMRDAGHEVAVYGQRNVLVDRIDELGLEFIESPRPRRRPTPSIVSSLRRLVRHRGIEVIHGYEWPPTLEAVLACHGTEAVAISTVLSMSVAPFIPHSVPLLVGTEQILAAEQGAGRTRASLMEPPIDTRLNSPDVRLPIRAFHRAWGIDPEAFTVVVVSRLAQEMKLEGILTAMESVRSIHRDRPVQLVVVGGGPAEESVQARAEEINTELGTRAIVVTGELLDPRPAYAIADVALGMGSSALRAMAFGKPVVVQGIDGFWEPLTPESLSTFLWQGWYGQGDGSDNAADRLCAILRQLMDDPSHRRGMGQLSLQTVRGRFSLVAAAERQLGLYEQSLIERRRGQSLGTALQDTAASLTRFARYSLGVSADRWRGRAAQEDFNSKATLVRAAARASTVRVGP